MNEIGFASPENSPVSPKVSSRQAALSRAPYALFITFGPHERKYTVHIQPADQHAIPRTAYFSELDLRNTLEHCLERESVDRIVAKAQSKGICDLRKKHVYLDIARAAALGWFGDVKCQSM